MDLHMGHDSLNHITVVVATLDRPVELAQCLASLKAQTESHYDLLLLKERGPLAAIRNAGLSQTRTPLVVFIDDDTICPTTWLSSITHLFQVRPEVVGVTGPAIIPATYRQHRDLFRYPVLKWAYDRLFLDPDSHLPGRITRAGAFTTAASEETCTYEGPVHYLEACNMAWRTETLRSVGGFDVAYGGIGDWSEPDAAARLRLRYGHKSLWFSPSAKLTHCPSQSGAYLLRDADARQRLENYRIFAQRWVPSTVRHRLYRAFLAAYYTWRRCSSH